MLKKLKVPGSGFEPHAIVSALTTIIGLIYTHSALYEDLKYYR